MASPFGTNNPGIGGLDELTSIEEGIVASIASLGSAGQSLIVNAGADGVEWSTPAGGGDVSAAANFAVDNVIIRSDGTTKGVQATGISISDTTNDISGVGSITTNEAAAPGTPATGTVVIYAKTDGKLYIKDDAGTETDLTASGGGTVDVVSNVATSTILGRITAGSGDSEELTATQVRALISVEENADVTDETNVKAALDGATTTAVTPASGDKILLLDASDSDNLKHALFSDFGGGGGIAWSDPVDADILPDTDSTRDIGTDMNRFAEIYGDTIYGAEFRAYDSVFFRDQTTSSILFVAEGAASAVNYLNTFNAATGAAPMLTASGTDTNISINLVPKGSGIVQAGGIPVVTTTGTQTLTNKTLTSPTINTPALGASSVDAITEIASALRTGSDTKLVTGTAGTSGSLAAWNVDGDLVDSGFGVTAGTPGKGSLLIGDGVSDYDEVTVGTNGFKLIADSTQGNGVQWREDVEVKAVSVESPTSTEDIGLFFTDVAITFTQLNAVLRGSSTPSVTWTIRHGSDRSATGNEVVTSGTTTTSTTTGSEVTSFNDATVPAGSWVWLETTAQSGTVDELTLSMEFTRD